MIIKRLTVANWRSILEPLDVGPFDERINIVHAPNGSGKSSLFEALRRGFFDTHLVTGSTVEEILPWGRTLTPEVKIEFEQAGVTYRIEKKFLDGACARLLRLEDGRFTPFADGRNADSKLRELLGATDTPGKGLSKQEHWGVCQALWAPQGALQLSSLSSNVTENLRSALGAQISDKSSSCLDDLLEERYASYFTKQGKAKSGKNAAPIIALEDELTVLQANQQDLLQKQQQFEDASRAVEDARNQRDQARRGAEEISRLLFEARRKAEAYSRIQSELEQRSNDENIARERYSTISQSIELISQARRDIATLSTAITGAEEELLGKQREEEAAQIELGMARGVKEQTSASESLVDQIAAELDEARSFSNEIKEKVRCQTKVSKIETVTGELKILRDQRTSIVAPTDKNIRDIRKAIGACEQAETSLKACQICLEIIPQGEAEIADCSSSETKKVKGGQSLTFSAMGQVKVLIEGFGRVNASGPQGDGAQHEETIKENKKKIEKLTQPFGHADPDRLQELLDQATALDQKIEGLDRQLEELLDEETADDVRAELARLDACITQRLLKFPEWQTKEPDISAIQKKLETTRKSVRTAIRDAEAVLETKQGLVNGLKQAIAVLVAEVRQKKEGLDKANALLVELTKDGQLDDARFAAKEAALLDWEAAKAGVNRCRLQLAEYLGNPHDEAVRLERQVQALEQEEHTARDQENHALGGLEKLSVDGIYSKLGRCEEKIEEVKAKIQSESLRMDALRLLYETVTTCKSNMVASVLSPVEQTASRMFSRIVGSKLGTIQLSEEFVPKGIKPGQATREVEICNLSGGEQEQLFLVARLALGQVLAKGERQLVVLDDVLNATDTGRLTRLLGLMEEASDHLQIVILTCHPERYRALGNANFINLQSLVGVTS